MNRYEKINLVKIDDILALSESKHAILIDLEERNVWIPKSVIDPLSEVKKEGDCGKLIINREFARRIGLVF